MIKNTFGAGNPKKNMCKELERVKNKIIKKNSKWSNYLLSTGELIGRRVAITVKILYLLPFVSVLSMYVRHYYQ